MERFEEAEGAQGRRGLLRLYCTIVVDRESQKPIVVGKGGDMIKRIGTAARSSSSSSGLACISISTCVSRRNGAKMTVC